MRNINKKQFSIITIILFFYLVLLDLACRADHDCSKIKYAKCSDNNKCVCKSNFLQLTSKTCAPLIGEYCEENSDCHPMNSRCYHKICQCTDGFVRLSNNQCLSSKYIYDK